MKGLFIKDYKLLLTQKGFLALILVVSGIMTVTVEDGGFVLGYMMMLGSIFSLNTISYDEYDNGNAFLFSLPISRKDYTLEKYCFALLSGFTTWLISLIFIVVSELFKLRLLSLDMIITFYIILQTMYIFQAVFLPLRLKFGGEKSRIVLMCLVGFVFAFSFVISRSTQGSASGVHPVFFFISNVSKLMFPVVITAFSLLSLFISYRISLLIMKKKEF